MIDKSILRLIKLQYSGEELEMYLKAWEKYTTYKSDCALTRSFKELARNDFVKKLKLANVQK